MSSGGIISLLLFVLLLAAIAVAGFCAGVETGFLSLSRVRLLSMVRHGSAKARRLAAVISDMSRALTTLLVCNNLAAVLVSTISAVLALRFFEGSKFFQSIWSFFIALLMLFVGEYLPKLLFASRPLRRSMKATRPYLVIAAVLSPIVAVFSVFVRFVFHVRPNSGGKRLSLSRDVLRLLVSAKEDEDATHLTTFERRLIERVLSLQATVAGDLIKPLSEDPYRRPPVPCVSEVCSPVAPELWRRRVPDCDRLRLGAQTRGDDILPAMRRSRQAVAIVFDEKTGKNLGVVTEEDVLLMLTGVLKEG